MSTRHMITGLSHAHAGLKQETFFAQIDEHGGWPLGYQFVGFEHTDERAAGFCNSPANTGWWTVLASADDYYMWKLSPEALQRLADAVRDAIKLPRVTAHLLWVRDSRGGRAVLQQPAQAQKASS